MSGGWQKPLSMRLDEAKKQASEDAELYGKKPFWQTLMEILANKNDTKDKPSALGVACGERIFNRLMEDADTSSTSVIADSREKARLARMKEKPEQITVEEFCQSMGGLGLTASYAECDSIARVIEKKYPAGIKITAQKKG